LLLEAVGVPTRIQSSVLFCILFLFNVTTLHRFFGRTSILLNIHARGKWNTVFEPFLLLRYRNPNFCSRKK